MIVSVSASAGCIKTIEKLTMLGEEGMVFGVRGYLEIVKARISIKDDSGMVHGCTFERVTTPDRLSQTLMP
ncbi:MAG: hypothetical protein KAT71_07350 [Gammaproteobacteria bacterium]|nr:hypothetical protein [Gammaproteobacteria bacterium]